MGLQIFREQLSAKKSQENPIIKELRELQQEVADCFCCDMQKTRAASALTQPLYYSTPQYISICRAAGC